jgi:hypothetical protein
MTNKKRITTKEISLNDLFTEIVLKKESLLLVDLVETKDHDKMVFTFIKDDSNPKLTLEQCNDILSNLNKTELSSEKK